MSSSPSPLAGFKQAAFPVKATLFALVAGLLFVISYYHATNSRLETKEAELTASSTILIAKVQELEKSLADAANENNDLNDALHAERRRNDRFASQIEQLSGTVSTLDKLSKTDPELLKKYSKISFLNENYLPEQLTEIDSTFVSDPTRHQLFLVKAEPFLDRMLTAAQKAGVDLRVVSAYRSFGTQASLKSQYTVVYGSGANQFSANQGYSEHQLGTAADFSTPTLKGVLDGFDADPAYVWLQKNAYKYGFILSYPKGNAYYQFEPWHWRFVGTDLAADLHSAGKNFYDLDQREIDTYLVKLFD